MPQYGWQRHDGRSYGRQTVVDEAVVLTMHMVKVGQHAKPRAGTLHILRSSTSQVVSNVSGPGGDWAVRIATARRPTPKGGMSIPRQKRVSLVMYISDEDAPKVIQPCTHCKDGQA